MDLKKAYHYTQCGLKNVWLLNGHDIDEDNPYGKFVVIHDMDGLHRVIARALVNKAGPLNGAEFRFLRKELDMSQKRIGEFMSRDRQTIANIEKSDEVDGLYDYLIRHMYEEHLDPTSKFVTLVEFLNELDRTEYHSWNFEETEGGDWRKAA